MKVIIYILGGLFVVGSVYGTFVYLPDTQLSTVSEPIAQIESPIECPTTKCPTCEVTECPICEPEIIVKEVEKIVIKEVIKEVPVEKIVERIVEKTVYVQSECLSQPIINSNITTSSGGGVFRYNAIGEGFTLKEIAFCSTDTNHKDLYYSINGSGTIKLGNTNNCDYRFPECVSCLNTGFGGVKPFYVGFFETIYFPKNSQLTISQAESGGGQHFNIVHIQFQGTEIGKTIIKP